MTFANIPDIEVDEESAASALGDLMRILGGDEGGEADPFTPSVSAPTQGAELQTTGAETSSPIAGNVPISGQYGEQRETHVHGGVDLSVPVGSQILAANSGTVTQAGNNDPGGYGNMIEIRGDDGIVTRYAHMGGINVAVGAKVRAGQPIGKSGGAKGAPGAGNSQGAHLHFEVRQGDKTMDPTPFLAGGYQVIGSQGADGQMSTPDPKAIAAVQIQNVLNVLEGKPMIDLGTSTEPTQTSETGEAGSDPDQWIRQAMAATGVDESWFAPLKARMMQESGGRNIPQGITDINTQKGTPAFGPMQVIEPTFRSHMMKGHEDWHNPVDNTIAAINYIKARYKHPSKLPKGGY